MSTELVDYDDFFHRITGYLPSTLPAGLQHFKIRHKPRDNWMVLTFREFSHSQYELHLAKRSRHHQAYFGEVKVNLVAFYYGGTGVSIDQRVSWLNTVKPYVELIGQQLGNPVVCGEWSENWMWIARDFFQAELEYVQDFIRQLKLLSVNDSKMEVLKEEINQVFKKRPKVLIFTQYTDTMDYLREQLVEVYGIQVACYSGRGGEVWNGIGWIQTTKEDVKNQFRQGNICILLGTESASEGLNLQTCGVLINYDMPWNPMRVEQRIGRIDRIGQEYKEVWIANYFYKDTTEDQI